MTPTIKSQWEGYYRDIVTNPRHEILTEDMQKKAAFYAGYNCFMKFQRELGDSIPELTREQFEVALLSVCDELQEFGDHLIKLNEES